MHGGKGQTGHCVLCENEAQIERLCASGHAWGDFKTPCDSGEQAHTLLVNANLLVATDPA